MYSHLNFELYVLEALLHGGERGGGTLRVDQHEVAKEECVLFARVGVLLVHEAREADTHVEHHAYGRTSHTQCEWVCESLEMHVR